MVIKGPSGPLFLSSEILSYDGQCRLSLNYYNMIKGENFFINPIWESSSLSDIKASLEMAGYQEINRTNLTMGPGSKERQIGFVLSLIDRISNCYEYKTPMGKKLFKLQGDCSYSSYFSDREIKIVTRSLHDSDDKIYHCDGIELKRYHSLDGVSNPIYFYFPREYHCFRVDEKAIADFIKHSKKEEEKIHGKGAMTTDGTWNWAGASGLQRLMSRNTRLENLTVFVKSLISWIIAVIQDKVLYNEHVLGVYVLPNTEEDFETITGLKWSEFNEDLEEE